MKLNMNNRYSILRIFFLAVTLFFGITEINATHIVGGEITYKYLGKDTFEITLTVRRDCELGADDAQFDDPAHISFYDGLTRRVRIDIGDLGLVRVPYSDDDTLNTFIRSECGFEGKQVCVHETKYKTKVRLPYTTRGFYVVYERCCRNSSLNNILDPLEAGSTYSVRIDRVPENQTNSSPVFTQWPDIYICKDRPLNFDHSAVDIDGDSLVYKLWNPFYGRSIESPALTQPYSRLPEFRPVQFLDGYGVNNFFGGDTLKINPITGVLTGTPNMVGQFLVGVEVQEFRDGKYLGSVYRDFQYNVRICAQPPVADFEFPNDCKSLTVAFENKSTGAGRYEWNFNYPGSDSTFFSKDSSPVFTFPQSGVYQVQLTTIRGTDECRNTVIRQVPVFDIDYLADFDYAAEDCGVSDSITIRLIDKSSISDNQFTTQTVNWVVTQNGVTRIYSGLEVSLKVSNSGNIQVNQNVIANNLCTSSISKTISVDDLVVMADFDLTNVSCDDDETVTIALEDKSIYRGSNDLVESRTWLVTTDGGDSFSSTEKMYMVTVPRSGITIQLIAIANGCADTLVQVIPASELFPKIDFKTALDECRDSSVLIRFVPSITNMSESVTITSLVWEVNGQISTDDSIMVELFGNEVVSISLKATLSNGCEINTSKAFTGAVFRPFANISVNAIECPSEDSVTYEAVYQGSLGYTAITWMVGLSSNPTALTGPSVTFTIPKDSAYYASATGIYVKGCDATAIKTGAGNFAKINFIANPLELCVGEQSKIVANPNPAFTYIWSPTSGLDLTQPFDPVVTGIENTTYSVTVSDGICSVTGQLQVNVSDSLRLAIFGDSIACDGNYTLYATGGKGKGQYIWSLSPGFEEIIATGDTISFNSNARTSTVYVTIMSEVCKVRPGSIVLNNGNPFVVKDSIDIYCPGDTFSYALTSGDGGEFTIMWEADAHIISSLSSSRIQIATSLEDSSQILLYFTASNAIGCVFRDSIILTPNLRPVLDFTYSRNNCETTEACFTLVGDENITNFSWDFGMAGDDDVSTDRNPCFVYPAFGTYTVTLSSNQEVCGFATVAKTINVSNQLDIIAQDDAIVCLGDTAFLRVVSSLPEMNITWLDSAGNILATGNEYNFVPVGDAKLFLKAVDAGGCEYTDSLNIIINRDFPPIINGGEFKVCIGDSAVLNVFEGDLTSYEIVWLASPYISGILETGSPMVNITEDSPSDIFLAYSIVNEDGCTSQGQIHLLVNPKNVIDFTFSKPDCNGNEVCFRIIGDYIDQVTWDFGNGSVLTGTIQQCFTYAEAGVYSVTAKSNTNFCGFDDITKTVIIGNQIDLIGADEVLLCSDDTATISVKSNLQGLTIVYLDEQGNVLANGPVYTFTPTADTKLILKATDLAMCEFFDTVAIKLNNNFPMLSVEGPFIVCEGDTATLPAFTQDVSGFNITWNQNQYIIGNLNVANPLVGFGGAAPGDVTLNFTVVNADGCIQQGAAPLVIRTKPTGDFSIVVDNCEDRRVCFTTDIDERVGIKWNFGNTNADNDTSLNSSVCYSYPGAGTYNVSLETTGDFCTLPLIEKPFTLYDLDEIVTPNIANVCLRDSFQTVVLDGVPTNFNIQWFDGNTQIAAGREISFQVLGSKMLTVVATDPNGCTYTDSIMLIGINEFPQLEYINIFPACLGDTVSLSLINTNPNHTITILWDENPHFVGRRDVLNPMVGIENDEMEPFYLYFTASTQFGCTLRDSIYFTPGTPNVVSIDHAAKDCDNYEVCFSIVGDYQGLVLWNFGDPNKPSGNVAGKEACFIYSGPGTYTVTITNISAFCAFKPTTKTITLRDGLVIFEDDTRIICKGESNQLTAPATVGNFRYEWFDLQGNSLGVNRPINVAGDQDKSIRILVTDDNGCPFDDTLSLDVFDPQYTINMPKVYCQDVEAQVEISFTGSSVDDYNYSWTPVSAIVSGANTHNPIIDVTNASTLFVIIEHKTNGCLLRDTVNVVPFTFTISAQASPDTVVDLNEEVTLSVVNPQNGWTYLWSNGVTSQSQTVIAEENTTYTVTVTDANGCTAETQVSIRVNPPDCEEDVYIPTAFSPNQDGNNDVLFVRSNYIEEMELIIFNRWGQEVFTSTSVNNGWDGTFKGKELSPDAFAYYLRAKCVDGNTITRKGNISLLR